MKKLMYLIAIIFVVNLNLTLAQQDIVNGDFEFWDTIPGTNGWEDPQGWTSKNYITYNCSTGVYSPVISKSTDAYNGNYSLKISPTILPGNSGIVLMEGNCQYINCMSTICDYYPVTYNHQKIVGYYKFLQDSAGTVTANIALSQIHYDSISGSPSTARYGAIWFSPVNNWTYFEVFIAYSTPQQIQGEVFRLNINLLSNPPSANAQAYLLIDSLALVPEVITGIKEKQSLNLILSPNPVKEKLKIENWQSFKTFEIYDLSGRLIHSGLLERALDVDLLNKGIYFIQLQGRDNLLVEKFVKE